jgi:magnesium chelatase family protein
MLMVGPPGSGKSMLASRLPGILPKLSPRELLEVSMIQSIAGDLSEGKLSDRRPFRAPHHSASMAAMVGGGLKAKPGEVSMSHNGVLFLDELPEFTPQVLDSLRQPLETGETAIVRANYRVTFPSRFQLIAAMNPCRCGMAGEPGHACKRGERCMTDYQARLSGPFMDRIDLRIEVPAISAADMITVNGGESSEKAAQRVLKAREIQSERTKRAMANPELASRLKSANGYTNASASSALLEMIAAPDKDGEKLLRQAAEKMKFSARAYHRILKVARTIADLDGSERVGRIHLAEAIAYRSVNDRLAIAA